MSVFAGATDAGGDALLDLAVAAAHELGVFVAAAAPITVAALADALALPSARRLGALVDVLVCSGALVRDGDRVAAPRAPPRPATPTGEGWAQLAAAIRADLPVAIDRSPAAVAALHAHLAAASAPAAREVATKLAGDSVLDVGGGAGAYTAAFLAERPGARATLVDDAAVLAVAAAHLAPHRERVALVAGDVRGVALAPHAVVVIANVLHFYPVAACRDLVGAAWRAVAPGGALAIVDLRVDDDRRGPRAGLLFALGMALYTDAGDAHSVGALRGLVASVGANELEVAELAAAPDAVLVVGRRPR